MQGLASIKDHERIYDMQNNEKNEVYQIYFVSHHIFRCIILHNFCEGIRLGLHGCINLET